MTTLIKLNSKEHENFAAEHTYNALNLIADTITVLVLMTTITIMMMIMMKDWNVKCDISGQFGSAPPGRACDQM